MAKSDIEKYNQKQHKKELKDIQQEIGKVRKLWEEFKYDKALEAVEQLQQAWPHNPCLLVMGACLSQLQDDDKDVMKEIKMDLELAVALDEDSPEATIELGYFIFVHEDDAKAAIKHFERAIHNSVNLLIQALIGHAEAAAELDKKNKALSSIMTACDLIGRYPAAIRDPERLKDLLQKTIQCGFRGC